LFQKWNFTAQEATITLNSKSCILADKTSIRKNVTIG